MLMKIFFEKTERAHYRRYLHYQFSGDVGLYVSDCVLDCEKEDLRRASVRMYRRFVQVYYVVCSYRVISMNICQPLLSK